MPDAVAPDLDSPSLARSLERWYVVGLACMGILIIAFPVYKRGEPARRARAVAERHASYVQLGAASYARHCAACHGVDARGGGPAPTLATREFLSTTSDAQLRWLIAGGVPGTAMVAYAMDFGGPFTAQDVEQVAEYLRSLEARVSSVPGWRTGERAPEPPPVVVAEAKPRSSEQAHDRDNAGKPARDDRGRRDDDAKGADNRERDHADAVAPLPPPAASAALAGPPDIANGRKIYAMACIACHGPEGRGAQLGPTLNAREFLAARTDAQLTVSIERGVPGTTMIGWAKARGGNLDDASIRDVVAYLRSWQPKAPSVPDWKTRRPTH